MWWAERGDGGGFALPWFPVGMSIVVIREGDLVSVVVVNDISRNNERPGRDMSREEDSQEEGGGKGAGKSPTQDDTPRATGNVEERRHGVGSEGERGRRRRRRRRRETRERKRRKRRRKRSTITLTYGQLPVWVSWRRKERAHLAGTSATIMARVGRRCTSAMARMGGGGGGGCL